MQNQIDTTPIPYTDMLYRFALDCADHKIRNTCDFNCRVCPSNVSRYGIDHQTAVMLQHSAELEMGHRIKLQHQYIKTRREYRQAKAKGMKPILVMFIVQFLVALGVTCLIVYNVLKPAPPPAPSGTPTPATVTVKPQVKVASDPLEPIRKTLRQIKRVDIDGDGLTNCIDYTLQFYDLYPEQDKVRIMYNNNKNRPGRKWVHLFVSVDDMPVEPGAYLSDDNPEKWFGMSKFWGDIYDPSLNIDLTYDVARIRDGSRWQ